MHADSHFSQGAGHTICQDHATTRETERFTFAVVSDGCSGSHKSEVGAGVLAHLFIQSYLEAWENACERGDVGIFLKAGILKAGIQNKMREVCCHTGLDHSAFDATIVAVVADKEMNRMSIFIWGDGHVVLKFKDGTVVTRSARYPSGAPYYFSYSLSQTRQTEYKTTFGETGAELSYNGGTPELVEPYYSEHWPLDILECVSVFSDGLETFTELQEGVAVPVPLDKVMGEVCGYKSTVGEFVKRRWGRFLKECRAKGISHYDDVSCAAIAAE